MKANMKRRSVRIVAALTLLVLLGCSPLRCGYNTGTTEIIVGRGSLDWIRYYKGFEDRMTGFNTNHGMPFVPHELADVFPSRRTGPFAHVIVLPLHLPAFLLLAMLAWLLTRKTPLPGHCRKCGYDLTGNISGRCPECATAVTAQAAGNAHVGGSDSGQRLE